MIRLVGQVGVSTGLKARRHIFRRVRVIFGRYLTKRRRWVFLKPGVTTICALHIAPAFRDRVFGDFILRGAVRADQTHPDLDDFYRPISKTNQPCKLLVTAHVFHSKYLINQSAIATTGSVGNYYALDESEHSVIELATAAYSYSGNDLLKDLTLRLAPGSFHFLTGPSGAGKTTLLRLCYIELLPTSGLVQIFNRDVTTLSRDEVALARRRIGVVHQDCKFLDHLTVAENIALPLSVSGRDASAQESNLDELLAWVGLAAQRNSLPPQLSGGERQRAALARAVVMSPDVIIADEPTGNIDWEMAVRLLNLLVELNRMGKTILIATHDLNLIRNAKTQVSARVLRIHNHRLQLAGADL